MTSRMNPPIKTRVSRRLEQPYLGGRHSCERRTAVTTNVT